ncbi:L,D-transpeptidase family protein [Chryseosolibacter indicus]|uniref:L,D-transpeptidase family protein n=1 Tax=Chryseosolibacter indicus TaxID=2782351 RepID=A0ABS5VVE5_9BACT|nr:L,D-transpeptidase family protein [Chryseosolibacter indicus]MBT1703966.1 L,D-transpeptidase family protein [Chryseosolibacter indicus]
MDTALLRNESLLMEASVRELYRLRNYSLQWYDTGTLNSSGDSLLGFIKLAGEFGLMSDHYHLQRISGLVEVKKTEQEIVESDMLLTDSFFAMRAHLKNGRVDPLTFVRKSYTDSLDSAGIKILISNITRPSIKHSLESQEPTHIQYRILKDSLKAFLAIHNKDSAAHHKIMQLQITMERWRHTKAYPDRYIQVNIPSYNLFVMEKGDTVLRSNVIVGKPFSRTPELESVITSFVIYPYWHVPRSIATKEILPSIQRDSMYLTNHNYEVLDAQGNVVDAATINWASLKEDYFPYQLRQREGRENSLGIIKFLFKNPYGVYLHDTNSRRLFSRENRALSHGCVRVEQRRDLARYLVRDDNVYVTPDDVDQYFSLQQRVDVRVRKPIPIFIQYFTCEYINGSLKFYKDVYQNDQEILNVLDSTNKMDERLAMN